jgi:hypothetical protein
MLQWILAEKLAELTGYTVEAIRNKKKKGVWLEGIHWTKFPDGRIGYRAEAIERWMQGFAYEAKRVSKSISRTAARDAERR